MGAAGKSYYALDVTTPRTISQSSLPTMWQFPAVGDATTQAKMGQTVGKARVVRHPTLGHVVLVTSGYNAAADGLGRMWMLNASTGAIIHEFVTSDGSAGAEAGLAQVSAYIEDNGSTRYVFGGDLLGNLWKFDLVSKTTTKLAVLKNGSGQAQPVTAAPELTQIAGQRVVIVGTGRLLDIGDFGGSQVQTMYAIADGATLSNARTALQQQTYSNDTTVTSNAVDWATQRGWYMDLPAGEKANSQPSIAYGAVAFVTNSNGSTDCSASSKLYVLDVKSGGFYGPAGFVSTTISDQANSSGVTALATASGKIIGSGQDADGNPWKRDLATAGAITPAKNAWREIRRR
jgi:type IV pilus assembly protein PilY1